MSHRSAEANKGRLIGKSVRRTEDLRFVTGRGTYVSDIRLPGMLHLAFLRSPYAHAMIKRIDVERARGFPGVVATMTGAEAAASTNAFPCLMQVPGVKIPEKFCLATDRVRFVGEPVACVVATTKEAADDALEFVEVEYEPLPAVTDPFEAMKGDVLVYDGIENNLYQHRTLAVGDVESAFRAADAIVEKDLKIQRHTGTPLEPRGVIASFERAPGKLTVRATTQIPNTMRKALAISLRLPETNIRVIVKDVGGGFGNYKYHIEDVAVSLMSMKLGRPVKWVSTRSELFLGGYHAREQLHHARIAADKNGKILALEDKIVAPTGAYLLREMTAPANVTLSVLPGPYDIRNMKVELLCVAENKAPIGAYRGFGMPEANFVMERLVDAVARRLGLDPSVVRERNLVPTERLPYRTATGSVHDSGNYTLCLRKAVKFAESERRRGASNHSSRGVGVVFFTEETGASPANMQGYTPNSGIPVESVTISVSASGRVTVLLGLMPHGQGAETTLAQVAAELLGCALDDVRVAFGDTDACPYGYGSSGSRTAIVGSGGIVVAAEMLKSRMKEIASHELGAAPGDLRFSMGRVVDVTRTRKFITFGEVAAVAERQGQTLSVTGSYEPSSRPSSYGAHVAVVDVDRETGAVSVVKYLVVHDCGTVLNPMIVDGQIHGGVMQGIGGAITEELVYNDDGQLLTTSFMDYAIPSATEAPNFITEHMASPSTVSPLGVKGVGEGGTIPVGAAISSAIEDALGGLDAVTETPLLAERVWRMTSSH